MGRPWWHDSYWEEKEKRRRGPWSPSRKSWAWVALVVLSLALTVAGTGFQPVLLAWLLGFVGYFCRILALAVKTHHAFSRGTRFYTTRRHHGFVLYPVSRWMAGLTRRLDRSLLRGNNKMDCY